MNASKPATTEHAYDVAPVIGRHRHLREAELAMTDPSLRESNDHRWIGILDRGRPQSVPVRGVLDRGAKTIVPSERRGVVVEHVEREPNVLGTSPLLDRGREQTR